MTQVYVTNETSGHRMSVADAAEVVKMDAERLEAELRVSGFVTANGYLVERLRKRSE